MLRCKRSLPGFDDLVTSSQTTCFRPYFCRISRQWLLAAALMSLPGSIANAQGQLDTPQADSANATLHPEQCDDQSPGDQHKLSTQSGGAPASTEGQESTRTESTLTKLPLRLPGVEQSTTTSDQDPLRCKQEHIEAAKESQLKATAGSADQPVMPQPVLPQADSTAPIVSYTDGELKVVGHGASLGRILEKVKALTGIALEVPQDGAENKIFDDVGPAPLRQALINLLDGARLNYLIVGSPEDPQGVGQVILTAQTSAPQMNKPVSTARLTTEEASGPALYGSGFGSVSGPDTAAVEQPVAPNPAKSIPANVNIQQAATAQGKTPGQILDELQKKQLQQLDDQAAQSAPQ